MLCLLYMEHSSACSPGCVACLSLPYPKVLADQDLPLKMYEPRAVLSTILVVPVIVLLIMMCEVMEFRVGNKYGFHPSIMYTMIIFHWTRLLR